VSNDAACSLHKEYTIDPNVLREQELQLDAMEAKSGQRNGKVATGREEKRRPWTSMGNGSVSSKQALLLLRRRSGIYPPNSPLRLVRIPLFPGSIGIQGVMCLGTVEAIFSCLLFIGSES
jgi:hypothetical protein